MAIAGALYQRDIAALAGGMQPPQPIRAYLIPALELEAVIWPIRRLRERQAELCAKDCAPILSEVGDANGRRLLIADVRQALRTEEGGGKPLGVGVVEQCQAGGRLCGCFRLRAIRNPLAPVLMLLPVGRLRGCGVAGRIIALPSLVVLKERGRRELQRRSDVIKRATRKAIDEYLAANALSIVDLSNAEGLARISVGGHRAQRRPFAFLCA